MIRESIHRKLLVDPPKKRSKAAPKKNRTPRAKANHEIVRRFTAGESIFDLADKMQNALTGNYYDRRAAIEGIIRAELKNRKAG